MNDNSNDKLGIIVKMQDELNGRFGASREDILKLPEDERLEWVRKFASMAIIECGEVQMAAKGRWWKIDKDWKGWDNLKEEVVDTIHFLLSMALATGMDENEILERYVSKNKKNNTRTDWKINTNSSNT